MQLTKDDFTNGNYARVGGAMRYGSLYREIADAIQEVGNGYLVPSDEIKERFNTTPKKLKGALWSAICGKNKVRTFRAINPDITADIYYCPKGLVVRRTN